jgi:cell division septum initiation protein DivIVA
MSEESGMVSISSHGALHPDEIARRSFPTVRKGVDGEAVRRYLEVIANDMRDLHEREQALRRRLADAERRAAEPELDEQTLLRAVGAETARILQTAHESAADVVAKAEARASDLLQSVSEEANSQAASQLSSASRQAEAMTEAARSEAVALLEVTRAECRRIVEEARDLRSSVLGDLSTRRRSLRVQLEQLRTGRDSLLSVVDAVGEAVDQLRDRLANAEHEARLAAAEAGDRLLEDEADNGYDDVVAESAAGFEAVMDLGVDLAEAASAVVEQGPAVVGQATAPETEELPELQVDDADGCADSGGVDEDGERDGGEDASGEDAGEEHPEGVVILEKAPLAAQDATEDEDAGEEDVSDEAVAHADEAAVSRMMSTAALYDVEAEVADDLEDAGAISALVESGAPIATSKRSVDELFAKIRASRSPADMVEAVPAAEAMTGPGPLPEPEPSPVPDPLPEPEPAPLPPLEADTTVILKRRAELVGPATTKLGRALKRTLQDDQNILLDALRHVSGAADLDSVLPEEPQRQRLEKATVAVLTDAWSIGFGWLGTTEPAKSAALEAGRMLASELASEVTRLLRHRLHEALTSGGTTGDGASEAASAAYREWRTGRTDMTAGDFVTRAFGGGAVAGGKGVLVTWVVDDDGQPCPDCDDNALAGEMAAGEEFPTGQTHPPVHSGCRCLLVPTNF